MCLVAGRVCLQLSDTLQGAPNVKMTGHTLIFSFDWGRRALLGVIDTYHSPRLMRNNLARKRMLEASITVVMEPYQNYVVSKPGDAYYYNLIAPMAFENTV